MAGGPSHGHGDGYGAIDKIYLIVNVKKSPILFVLQFCRVLSLTWLFSFLVDAN